jgi:hypothetical protein
LGQTSCVIASEAKQSRGTQSALRFLDRRVGALLAMTIPSEPLLRGSVAAAQFCLHPIQRVAQSLRLGDGSSIILCRRRPAGFGLAAHLARLPRSDSLGAIVRLPQATGDGLELIDGLALDFRRSGHGYEFVFRAAQESSFLFGCIIHGKLLIRWAVSCLGGRLIFSD